MTRERDGADLGHPLDDVRHLGAEGLADALDGGEGVLDDIVQQAGGDADHVQLQLGEDVGHFQGVDEVGLARMAHLPLVFEGGKHVGPAQQLQIGLGAVAADFFQQILEANHRFRCLTDQGEGPGAPALPLVSHSLAAVREAALYSAFPAAAWSWITGRSGEFSVEGCR
jgi:hypothetical protein